MNGNTPAEAELLRHYKLAKRITWKAGLAHRKNDEEIEDVLHEVFVNKLLRRLRTIQPEKREAFVAKTTKFEAQRRFRRRRIPSLIVDVVSPQRPSWDGETTTARSELLQEAIEALDAELRSVIEAWLIANGRKSAVSKWARARGYGRAKGYKLFLTAKQEIRTYILSKERDTCRSTVYSPHSARRFLRNTITFSKVVSVA